MKAIILSLEKILASGRDNAMLRFALGQAYFDEQEYVLAAKHLAKAIEFDRDYSAAWKSYAQTLTHLGERQAAIEAYQKGISVAEKKGDMQVMREMRVFLKRLEN